MWLDLGLLKKTLFAELDQFFFTLGTGEQAVTKSALCQARQKLLPRFFQDFFQYSVSAFYRHLPVRRWRGFRLWATDGTGFRLPDAPGLGETFGWHGNQHNRVPSTRLLLCFDVLNQLIASARFHTRHTAESVVAQRQIARLPKDVLMIYDRGYAGHIIPFLHLLYGSHCLIRLPEGFSNTVKAFVESGKNQAIITEYLQWKARLALRELGAGEVPLRTTITYRLIRIPLPKGNVEVLLIPSTRDWTKNAIHTGPSACCTATAGASKPAFLRSKVISNSPIFRPTGPRPVGTTSTAPCCCTTCKPLRLRPSARPSGLSTAAAAAITSPIATSRADCSNDSSCVSSFAHAKNSTRRSQRTSAWCS